VTSRVVLALSLGVMWLNFALTSRWAHVPGSVHGAKEPVFVLLLVLASAAALWRWTARDAPRWMGRAALGLGLGLLVVSFFQWFPWRTWNQLPFHDNWATRFQVTAEGLSLYLRGTAAGWRWDFLGGYHTSSDISQPLSTIAALPMLLLGERVGFHAVHLLVLVALPLLVYVDLRLDREDREAHDAAGLAAGLVALTVTGWFSYFMARSGDTNSMSGMFCAVAALVGNQAASKGRRWGAPLLVGSMALMGHCHTGYIVYTSALFAAETLYYRDWRRAGRAAIGVAVAILVALPLTWESWRYPSYFNVANSAHARIPFRIGTLLRQIYYNVEILFLPGRWFNDFTGLMRSMLPVLLLLAWRRRGRTSFYAWASLTVLGLTLLNSPYFGYAFVRPLHLQAVLPAVAIAAFLVQLRAPRLVLAVLVCLMAAYVQVYWWEIPHIAERRDLDPQLVDYVRGLDGATVLVENAFHRDMDDDATRQSEKTPFIAHIEGYLAAATGKRLYAGLWDGWQWNTFRANLLANGAFQNHAITGWPPDDLKAQLHKWGIRHAVVWSADSTTYLSSQPGFARRWSHGRWTAFELLDADPRDVVVPNGTGRLATRDWLGATVSLGDAKTGDEVVVRTNFFPAWTATCDGTPVALHQSGGQLAFYAPKDGSYVVTLVYPTRQWLLAIAGGALLAGLLACARLSPKTRQAA
jgi:hypothetical protein